MMYRVILSRKAKKSLPKLPKAYQLKVRNVIASLKLDPYIGKKLEGKYKNDYSVRIWPYRIVYTIKKKELVIEVIEIESRGQAYKK
ncbi:type II toxin-antitoxin system RelE/ParE family toxin [Patescibacteria group bacterium]|nr:type II toxin-antitoxin system RelE/ParE family toxin [Patescibacteria group bacterium]